MNFLAHCHLSGGYDGLLLGNFMADFLKGWQKPEQLPMEVAEGLKLHHAIDSFTDSHPMVRQGYQRLKPRYGRYSSVIIDVFYDHLLAKNWTSFHPTPLPEFAQTVYRVFERRREELPPRAQRILPHMVQHDWLSNYAGTYGIERALEGLSRRASFENRMDEAVNALLSDFHIFNEEFLSFFPEIIAHVRPFWARASQMPDAV